LQPHYNLVHRTEFEEALAELCRREDMGVIPYSPLAGGFLTGKYREGRPLPESQRSRRAGRYMNDEGFGVLAAVEAVAAAHDTTVPAAALAWLLSRPPVTAPIIGANTPEQLADLLPASGLQLTPDETRALDAASAAT
jgi:aryl-alcohol dehydrogenase (NADP+)